MRSWVQATLRRFGYQLVRNTRPKPRLGASHSDAAPVPARLREQLRPDHPRLLELRQRYAALQSPIVQHTWWTPDYVRDTIDLAHFRGDNAYVWQTRHMPPDPRQAYYLYASDVAARDGLGLFGTLPEDGAFGCWVYRYRRFPALSRDLLDSVNELNFLQRHAGIRDIRELGVLDIGAGYGRLAHRSEHSLPGLAAYYCVDGVAESTFLCEFYLQHRGCTRARVVPADRLDDLRGRKIDLAVNVHSFSEMSRAAIEAWLDLVRKVGARYLFIVPNDAEAFLSMEADGTRRDFSDAIAARGFRELAREPAIADPDVRELVAVADHLFLFERRT